MEPPRTAFNPRLKYLAFFVGIVGILLACYGPALRGGLVWDDAAHVTRADLRSMLGLKRIWTDLHATQQYYPVLHSAFWIEHRLWGDATVGYHVANVMFHAASCVLLVLVLRRIWTSSTDESARDSMSSERGSSGLSRGTEWLAGALFAVHPVCVESVAWISEQKNTLSLLFYLGAAVVYLKFHDTRRWLFYVGATLLFLLALGTKTVTASLPAALLVIVWWRNGAIRWRSDVWPLLPWFVVGAAAGLFTAWVERTLVGAHGTAFALSAGERLLLAGRVIWFYAGKLVWPSDLMFIYPHWEVHQHAAEGWVYLAAAIAVTLVLWALSRWTRGPLAAWLFFVGSLFPALGFFDVYPFQFSYVADHFQYLPSLGIVVLLAGGIAAAHARTTGFLCVLPLLGWAAAVVFFAVLARTQSRQYRDSETLYRTTLERNPSCWMAHLNLASELVKTPAGVSEAILHDRAALLVQPENASAHNNLGTALLLTPDAVTKAIEEFEQAVRLDPTFTEARLNLANALALVPARMPEALTQYAEVVRETPDRAEPHFCLGNTLAKLPGRAEEARREYETALQLCPGFADAHANYAALLAGVLGDREEALSHYREALRLAPDSAKTHYNFALALEATPSGRAEAKAHYEEALRLNPDYAEAHNNLGILCAQSGEFDQARRHWEAAVRLNPRYEDPRRNLQILEKREAQR